MAWKFFVIVSLFLASAHGAAFCSPPETPLELGVSMTNQTAPGWMTPYSFGAFYSVGIDSSATNKTMLIVVDQIGIPDWNLTMVAAWAACPDTSADTYVFQAIESSSLQVALLAQPAYSTLVIGFIARTGSNFTIYANLVDAVDLSSGTVQAAVTTSDGINMYVDAPTTATNVSLEVIAQKTGINVIILAPSGDTYTNDGCCTARNVTYDFCGYYLPGRWTYKVYHQSATTPQYATLRSVVTSASNHQFVGVQSSTVGTVSANNIMYFSVPVQNAAILSFNLNVTSGSAQLAVGADGDCSASYAFSNKGTMYSADFWISSWSHDTVTVSVTGPSSGSSSFSLRVENYTEQHIIPFQSGEYRFSHAFGNMPMMYSIVLNNVSLISISNTSVIVRGKQGSLPNDTSYDLSASSKQHPFNLTLGTNKDCFFVPGLWYFGYFFPYSSGSVYAGVTETQEIPNILAPGQTVHGIADSSMDFYSFPFSVSTNSTVYIHAEMTFNVTWNGEQDTASLGVAPSPCEFTYVHGSTWINNRFSIHLNYFANGPQYFNIYTLNTTEEYNLTVWNVTNDMTGAILIPDRIRQTVFVIDQQMIYFAIDAVGFFAVEISSHFTGYLKKASLPTTTNYDARYTTGELSSANLTVTDCFYKGTIPGRWYLGIVPDNTGLQEAAVTPFLTGTITEFCPPPNPPASSAVQHSFVSLIVIAIICAVTFF